jgi:aminoglycoside phosphotransferase (APT) family kinase protein
MPAAEVDVTPELLRRLLAGQHPDLAGLPVTAAANGWDNVVFRVGDGLLARLPRREMGARLTGHEQQWLPRLATQLPLPIPAPVRTGRPGLGYPWPWSIVPYIPGQVAAETPPADPAAAAVSLGGRPCGEPGPRRWPRRGGQSHRYGCTATCTRPTSWCTTAGSAA